MAVAFDTYTQRLEEVGVTHDQAERHAELARDMLLGELVSVDDPDSRLRVLRAETGLEFAKVRTETAGARSEIVRTIVIAQLATILVIVLGPIFR